MNLLLFRKSLEPFRDFHVVALLIHLKKKTTKKTHPHYKSTGCTALQNNPSSTCMWTGDLPITHSADRTDQQVQRSDWWRQRVQDDAHYWHICVLYLVILLKTVLYQSSKQFYSISLFHAQLCTVRNVIATFVSFTEKAIWQMCHKCVPAVAFINWLICG